MKEVFSLELLKLNKLHKRAVNVLFKCKTVFPFDFFPDTLIIDHNKIDIIHKHFFFESQTVSISIQNINYVKVDSGILFSALKFKLIGLEQNPKPLNYLRKKDAITAQRLIFGLISAGKHHIDLSDLPKEEIFDKLIEIGTAA